MFPSTNVQKTSLDFWIPLSSLSIPFPLILLLHLLAPLHNSCLTHLSVSLAWSSSWTFRFSFPIVSSLSLLLFYSSVYSVNPNFHQLCFVHFKLVIMLNVFTLNFHITHLLMLSSGIGKPREVTFKISEYHHIIADWKCFFLSAHCVLYLKAPSSCFYFYYFSSKCCLWFI